MKLSVYSALVAVSCLETKTTRAWSTFPHRRLNSQLRWHPHKYTSGPQPHNSIFATQGINGEAEAQVTQDNDNPNNTIQEPDTDGTCEATETPQIPKIVMLISDSTGVTAKSALQKSLYQFDSCDERFATFDSTLTNTNNNNDAEDACEKMQTRVFTFVRSEAAIAAIIKKAKERQAMVMYTLVNPQLRAQTQRMCELSQVIAVDVLGPMLDGLSTYLNRDPAGVPMRQVRRTRGMMTVTLSDEYYRRIDAVEFTLKADDGQAPWLLKEADVILVGVSRTGKTPLSVVLSQTMGFKVANVPLVLEVPPPKELFEEEIDPRRVFCLTINPNDLKRIRKTRLSRRHVLSTEAKYAHGREQEGDVVEGPRRSTYSDRNYVLKDLLKARELAREHDWTEIDVSGRAVEETASVISELMPDRYREL